MRLISWIAVNTLALAFTTWLFADIWVDGRDWQHRALHLIVVGIIFGLVNALVKPVVKLLSLPFIILTLGLLLLVINALLLLLTSAIAGTLNLGFHVHGFWTAFLAAIVLSVVGAVLSAVLPDE